MLVLLNVLAFSPVWRPTGSALGAANALTAAVLTFLVKVAENRRVGQVRKRYTWQVRNEPLALMGGEELFGGDIVGRDELCEELAHASHSRRDRTPQLLLGGAGSGKTSTLVRLAVMLARRGLVPVLVRLDGDGSDLDLREAARRHFFSVTDAFPEDDRRRAWERLCEDDELVVLADDVEEAFPDALSDDRESLIRSALRAAEYQRIPLIAAASSRGFLPHGTGICVNELGPIDEEEALNALLRSVVGHVTAPWEWLVKNSGMTEAPLYLQIALELARLDLLETTWVECRPVDQATVRLGLHQAWEHALVHQLHRELPLTEVERIAVLDWLSALACVGLLRDSAVVPLNALEDDPLIGPPLVEDLSRRLRSLGADSVDVRMAVTFGEQLALVAVRGANVHFPSGLLQTYLGSRLMSAVAQVPHLLPQYLGHGGRELHTALVLHSRAIADMTTDEGLAEEPRTPVLCAWLCESAENLLDARAVDLWAAAVEIDIAGECSELASIADSVARHWEYIHAVAREDLEKRKIRFTHRLGEALRVAESKGRGSTRGLARGYRLPWTISCNDAFSSVRLAAAGEIGDGGTHACAELGDSLPTPHQSAGRRPIPSAQQWPGDDEHRARVTSAWLAPLLAGSAVARVGDDQAQSTALRAREGLRRWIDHLHSLLLTEEIALARGFKYAANRTARHPCVAPEATRYLVEQAHRMLSSARHWVAQVMLLHALTLWSLSDGAEGQMKDGGWAQDTVDRWTSGIDLGFSGGQLHPFVKEAAALAVLTLESGQPERFLWLDERELLAHVGSLRRPRRYWGDLWLPASTGWKALSYRARQLLADLTILLNLTERDGRPRQVEQRLAHTLDHRLPPCLTRTRSPLDPYRTAAGGPFPPGGACPSDCSSMLCPYPALGTLPPRAELPSAFCRAQLISLRRSTVLRRKVPWHRTGRAGSRRFWDTMMRRVLRG
ncbi:hypothetical protein ACTPOK_36390 [Streptomyces inhibens]|uniref:hypothetical protein n=1 Tax=Streptomyces inhibens TaxID=2293571 RepID=UPI00402AB581